MAQERLAAGNPDFFDPQMDKQMRQAGNFFKSEDFPPVYPLVFFQRHAIPATEVAPVRNGNPEIFQRPAKRILQSLAGRTRVFHLFL
jgi:hypothetical protein